MKTKTPKKTFRCNECGEIVKINEKHTYNDCETYKTKSEDEKEMVAISTIYNDGFNKGKAQEQERILKILYSSYPDIETLKDRNIFLDWKELIIKEIKADKQFLEEKK